MRTLVALSGGVDSAVAAALLAESGHELVGLTMKNWCYGKDDTAGEKSCCSLESIDAARRVADRLKFPHYVVDFERPFAEHVIEPFIREYLDGRTPNPCVRCNANVRFPGLLERARAFGCERLATGHYARVERRGERTTLRRAADTTRDQSYMLWGVAEDALARLVLPLGHLTKRQVRELASERDLPSARRPDSQEICFVPDAGYGAFLDHRADAAAPRPATLDAGEIVTRDGKVVGTHRGVARYTIGQRRGLGVSAGHPLFVVALDARRNRVIVGPESALRGREAILTDVRWSGTDGEPLRVQLRSRHQAAPAALTLRPGGRARVVFREPQRALTPGQSAVFYQNDLVVGGGVVDVPHGRSVEPRAESGPEKPERPSRRGIRG